MPEGMPTPAQLWHGEISFFSIDTDVIQGAGYNFEAGVLNQLHKQLPSSMELQLTDVVANEVVNHLMVSVNKSIQEFEAAAADLKRKADLPTDEISKLFTALNPEESSRSHFRKRVEDYAEKCRGGVLPTDGEGILSELFRRYFAVEAPFETKSAKKSEFPDATALLVLEAYAEENYATGIVVSGDGGWEAFASQSEYLYCVKTLEELTTIFTATGDVPNKIEAAIREAIEDHHSQLFSQLRDELEYHVTNSTWDIGDIYPDSGTRAEGEVSDVRLTPNLYIDNTNIWNEEGDPSKWLIEVTAIVTVEVTISASVFVWDSIDRDEVKVSSSAIYMNEEIEVAAFLTCSNVTADSKPVEWDVDVEIGAGNYSVDVGEVQAFPWDES